MMLLLWACAHPESSMRMPAAPESTWNPPSSDHYVLSGGEVVGQGRLDVEVEGGRILAVGEVDRSLPTVDVRERWLVPAFIDSHVHLAYLPRGPELADGGIVAAVDLASPLSFLSADLSPLRLIRSGPMITAPSGYPTTGWGRDGYGLECADAAATRAAINQLHDQGAQLIKIPIDSGPRLSDAALDAAIREAHRLGMKVVSHALGDEEAAVAAEKGVDALAHTPVETLSEETLQLWKGKAVITTLSAFGGAAPFNLRRLRDEGVTVLYGTDFGNTASLGISSHELQLMSQAGMDGAAILTAGTSAPAAYWGLSDLGAIAPGKSASILVLSGDPLTDPEVLATPAAVILDGKAR